MRLFDMPRLTFNVLNLNKMSVTHVFISNLKTGIILSKIGLCIICTSHILSTIYPKQVYEEATRREFYFLHLECVVPYFN